MDMATEPQINANRRNSQFSTGPVTDTGKANSSRNHLTLGLYTRTDYVKPEERDYYKEFCETMVLELAPITLLEQTLTSEITGASWRLRRCSNAEAELGDFDEATDKQRRSIERARSSAHSLLHRSINQLRKMKKDRAGQEKLNLRCENEAAKQAAKAEKAETDAMEEALMRTLDNIMNCPEPDWDAIDRDIAARRAAEASAEATAEAQAEAALGSNCQPTPEPSPAAPASPREMASNCQPTTSAALMAALNKRNLPCACKSGLIYRNCCGINEPRDWRKAA